MSTRRFTHCRYAIHELFISCSSWQRFSDRNQLLTVVGYRMLSSQRGPATKFGFY